MAHPLDSSREKSWNSVVSSWLPKTVHRVVSSTQDSVEFSLSPYPCKHSRRKEFCLKPMFSVPSQSKCGGNHYHLQIKLTKGSCLAQLYNPQFRQQLPLGAKVKFRLRSGLTDFNQRYRHLAPDILWLSDSLAYLCSFYCTTTSRLLQYFSLCQIGPCEVVLLWILGSNSSSATEHICNLGLISNIVKYKIKAKGLF